MMKNLIILAILLLSCSMPAQTRFDCVDCEKLSRSNCSACDEYGANTEYFSGLMVTKRGKKYQIYKPYQLWSKGNTAYLQDWRGNYLSIALPNTNYSTMFNLMAALSECQCPVDTSMNTWVYSDGFGNTVVISDGEQLNLTVDGTMNVGVVGNTATYSVDTAVIATQYDLTQLPSASSIYSADGNIPDGRVATFGNTLLFAENGQPLNNIKFISDIGGVNNFVGLAVEYGTTYVGQQIKVGMNDVGAGLFVSDNLFVTNSLTGVSGAVMQMTSADATIFSNPITAGWRMSTNPDPDVNIILPSNGLLSYDATDHDVRSYVNGSWVSLLADNWGTQVVEHDLTMTGQGILANVLKVDTTIIATQSYVNTVAPPVAAFSGSGVTNGVVWRGVAFGKEKFVTVGDAGVGTRIQYTLNGADWNDGLSVVANDWKDVAFGNGRFVAVASAGTGRIAYSDDGITWTEINTHDAASFLTIAFGNGVFVALSSVVSLDYYVSTDGINWTTANTGLLATVDPRDLAFGNGRFAAMGYRAGAKWPIYSDITGTVWADGSYPGGVSINSEDTYFDGVQFIATGTSTLDEFAVSSDGINWTTAQSNVLGGAVVNFDGTNYVFNRTSTIGVNNLFTSNTAWSTLLAQDTIPKAAWEEAVAGNGVAVAVAAGTGFTVAQQYLTYIGTPNFGGDDWGNQTVVVDATLTGNGTIGDPLGIATGSVDNTRLSDMAALTLKGNATGLTADPSDLTGTQVTAMLDVATITVKGLVPVLSNVATEYLDGTGSFSVPAGGGGGGGVTTIGDSWANIAMPSARGWVDVAYGDGKFVAISTETVSTYTAVSNDGKGWQQSTFLTDGDWRAVTFGKGLFVSIADDGVGNRVHTSPDGVNWTAQASSNDARWRDVVFGNNTFVAVAASGGVGSQVMTSSDGINWTSRTSAEAVDYRRVIWTGQNFVAIASSGSNRAMTSADGISWTVRTMPALNSWFGLAYGDGTVVASSTTGTLNRIATSTDHGVSWTLRTTPANDNYANAGFAEGRFIVMGNSGAGQRYIYSDDLGVTWTEGTNSDATNGWQGMAYGNGRMVVVANTGTNRTMSDGKSNTSDFGSLDSHEPFNDILLGEFTALSTAETYTTTLCDVSAGAVSVRPPTVTGEGFWFAVSDSRGNAATNNITVDFLFAGANLNGSAQNYVISTNGGFVRFTYKNSAVGWVISN